MLIAALFTETKIWKQPTALLMDEWVEDVVCTVKNYTAIKRDKILPSVTT